MPKPKFWPKPDFDLNQILNKLLQKTQYQLIYRTGTREGVIIECPLNGQYHDARDVILTSRTDVREMVDDDDDDERPLVIWFLTV